MKSKNENPKSPKPTRPRFAGELDFRSLNVKILVYFYGFVIVTFLILWIWQSIVFGKMLDPRIMSVFRVQLLMVTIISLIIGLIASWMISYQLAKPIARLSSTAKRFADGETNVSFKDIKGYTEIDELSQALTQMTEKLMSVDTLRKDLMANVSHDLRTPLTMIKAYAEMIRDVSGQNPEKRNKHVAVIIEEADRLTSLVKDILDLSKLEANSESMTLTAFDFTELNDRVLNRFQYLKERGYQIEENVSSELFVLGDEHRIEQVIYNLVSNAVNYTGEDKIVIVNVFRTQFKTARFEVKDSGKGIEADEIDKVWERYYRASKEAKRLTNGTGLGLSIVKNILTAHGAKFGIQSVVGKGTTFWFELPEAPKSART